MSCNQMSIVGPFQKVTQFFSFTITYLRILLFNTFQDFFFITNMNRKRLHTGCRIFVQLILVTSLLTVTFVQFLKLKKETTNVGISYNDGKQDLELPSITFCPNFLLSKQENITFEEYMKQELNISDFFVYGAIYMRDKEW